ncbi:hypothetical protein ACFU7Y_16885 [Kitasatospora sp. NPDC057542]|uniref:hypothetical protein n=1 Tax=Streptomycetaceae TaxID=2062 RepID=UPI001CCBE0F3|nr:hypothetical protein [Streptomyces sp. LS1784]
MSSISSPRPRRSGTGLGPGVAGRAFAVVGRAPRSPLPWSQESVDDELQSVLVGHQQLVAARWEAAFEDLDEDVLGEVAQEARQDGQDPGRAVDVFVRSLIRQLEDWKQAGTALEEALEKAALGRPAGALAAEQGRLWGARQALLEAVARHHHGGPALW